MFRLVSMLRSILRREKLYVFEMPTVAEFPIKAKAKVNVDVDLVRSDKILEVVEKLGGVENIGGFLKDAKKRLEMGHLCFVAKLNDEPVHITWFAFDEFYVGEIKRKIRVSRNSAYSYSTYTVPKFRGLGIYFQVTEKAHQYLSKIGIKKVYSCVLHDNFPMLKAKRKVGDRKIGTIMYFKIFKWEFYKFKGETKEYSKILAEMFPPENIS
jgi:GNAT superfamily N-acetyltransferase